MRTLGRMPDVAPFAFQSSATINRYTGLAADSTRALARGMRRVAETSIYYHVHHALFRRHFTMSEYMNDFARWAWHTLHEQTLAEKLAAVDPLVSTSLHEARMRLANVSEEELGNTDYVKPVRRSDRSYSAKAQPI